MKRKQMNSGSAVIEMTLLIPIILGVFYLYISLFLFLIESSKDMEKMVAVLYSSEESQKDEKNSGNVSTVEQGSTRYVSVRDASGMFEINLQLCCYGESAVNNIRRWQLAADTFRAGENE